MSNRVLIELNDPDPSIYWGKKVAAMALQWQELGFYVEVKLNGSTMSVASIIASIGSPNHHD
jgi:hypothetical protein